MVFGDFVDTYTRYADSFVTHRSRCSYNINTYLQEQLSYIYMISYRPNCGQIRHEIVLPLDPLSILTENVTSKRSVERYMCTSALYVSKELGKRVFRAW